MLMVQERTGRTKSPKPSHSDDSRESDDSLENALVSLLGQLDFEREKMAIARDEGRPGQLLALAEDLLKHVSAFADDHVPLRSSLEMKAAESKANEFRSLIHQLKNRKNLAVEEALVRQALLALQEAVLANFSAFTRRFSTSSAARSWVDVAATFVVELKLIPPGISQ